MENGDRKKVVYTGGTFDIPHVGHVNFLNKCAEYGNVVVALNTDAFIEKYKGAKSLFTYRERAELLSLLPSVTSVIPNIGGENSVITIELVKPDIIAIGSDWATKDYYKQMGFNQQYLNDSGITLIYIPYTEAISSSEIKKRCRQK